MCMQSTTKSAQRHDKAAESVCSIRINTPILACSHPPSTPHKPTTPTGAKDATTSGGGGGSRASLSSASAAALLLTPQGLGQYQRMFHTRVLDYEPLVAVVVEMLQGAFSFPTPMFVVVVRVRFFLGGGGDY
jgi:hypothetical protein